VTHLCNYCCCCCCITLLFTSPHIRSLGLCLCQPFELQNRANAKNTALHSPHCRPHPHGLACHHLLTFSRWVHVQQDGGNPSTNTSVPVAVINCSCVNSEGQLEPNVLMATVVQSIDVVIGAGNPTAVGVRMRGAQGSSLEDIAVFAASDAFAGVAGVSGSGGAHGNITVVGARIGLDARETQPSATISNLRLFNQTCAAILHEGLETLTIAGLHIVAAGSGSESGPLISTGSSLVGLPHLGQGSCAGLLTPATGVPQSSQAAGALSVVDAVFECVGCTVGRAVVATNRNIYLRRAAVVGLGTIAFVFNATGDVVFSLPVPGFPSADTTNGTAGSGGGHAGDAVDIHELSLPIAVSPPTINCSAFVDGKVVSPAFPHGPAVFTWGTMPTGSLPPTGLACSRCDRHGWGDNVAFPTAVGTSRSKLLNVKDHGAVGDGVHDDTEALQQAVHTAAGLGVPVFLPRGVYRTCTSVVVPRGGQILGLARHSVQIVANDVGFGTCAGDPALYRRILQLRVQTVGATGSVEPEYSNVSPLLYFSNFPLASVAPDARQPAAGLGSLLFGVTLYVPTHNTRSNASHWGFRAGVSAPHEFNVYRQSWQTRRPPCGEWLGGGCGALRAAQLPYNAAYGVIAGADAALRIFSYYQEDGVANNGAESQSPFSRKLLVNGTRGEISIYQLNGEHSVTTAYSEFINTSRVAVYGCKSESSLSLSAVIVVRTSTNFSSYGHGGAAHVSGAPIGPESCNAVAPCPWNASLYRVIDSDNVRFVNLQGQFYAAASSMMFEVHDGVAVSAPPGDWPAVWFRTPE
jgi:hypothetical protein